MNIRLKMKILSKYRKQIDFAKALGITATRVSRVVHESIELLPEEQKKWAEKLSCEPNDIFKPV
ncbi:hypothetical protein [Desulfobacter curvatus]|uniref:hypothetical protein n=1 Tax=Desulfobacter curvatus TaxID=2290 RepID=UPI00037784AD|nr:hypothetical protein [Desulfobacter curvatus]